MTTKRDQPTKEEIVEAARKLGVEPAAMAAVAEVESGPQGAFDDQGRPTILYERHVFHRLTKGLHGDQDVVIPYRGKSARYHLSMPNPGGYGPFSHQWPKVLAAQSLDTKAAWSSCSWGLFQIMGENYRQAGHADIWSFRLAMEESVVRHLEAFCAFIAFDTRMLFALQAKNWDIFARFYNGPSFAKNKYDQKLKAAYDRLRTIYGKGE